MSTDADLSELPIHLLALPVELLEKTCSFLKYEELGTCRLVCKTLDRVCQQLLNQGFSSAEKLHGVIYKEIKSKLPRRESERRSHPLARHMDLLAAMETRLSLLAMTYIKYMEMGVCCFIPGKVLDEIYHILLRIRNDPTPPRPHELLTELRDISSMAMEHFEEKIVPVLKSRIRQSESHTARTASLTDHSMDGDGSNMTDIVFQIPAGPSHSVMNSRVPPLRMELVQLRNSLRSTSSTVLSLRKEVSDYKSVLSDQHKKMLEQDKKIIGLNRTLAQSQKKINDQEKAFAESQKKIVDQEKAFIDLQNSVLRLEGRLQRSGTGEEAQGSSGMNSDWDPTQEQSANQCQDANKGNACGQSNTNVDKKRQKRPLGSKGSSGNNQANSEKDTKEKCDKDSEGHSLEQDSSLPSKRRRCDRSNMAKKLKTGTE